MSHGRVVRVVLVDDHAIVREGFEMLLAKDDAIAVVGSVGSGAEALSVCRDHAVDVVLLDLRMPDMDGIETLEKLRAEHPGLAVVFLTSDARAESLRRAMEAGATGFLPKSVRVWDLVEALRRVAQTGRLPLSPELKALLGATSSQQTLTDRETEILQELARGASNDEIAECMGISHNTVKTHVNNVLAKVGATSRTQAVVMAIRSGLIDLD